MDSPDWRLALWCASVLLGAVALDALVIWWRQCRRRNTDEAMRRHLWKEELEREWEEEQLWRQ